MGVISAAPTNSGGAWGSNNLGNAGYVVYNPGGGYGGGNWVDPRTQDLSGLIKGSSGDMFQAITDVNMQKAGYSLLDGFWSKPGQTSGQTQEVGQTDSTGSAMPESVINSLTPPSTYSELQQMQIPSGNIPAGAWGDFIKKLRSV